MKLIKKDEKIKKYLENKKIKKKIYIKNKLINIIFNNELKKNNLFLLINLFFFQIVDLHQSIYK